MPAKISPNMEDYLEAIHRIKVERGSARVKDIADHLEISKPSVTGAMKTLEKQGYVSHSKYDLVELTSNGLRLAKNVYRRHRVLQRFLTEVLGLDGKTAETDACRMEHGVSQATLEGLVRFVETRLDLKD
jgi:DtxR family transcriptional regulator, Mn-dependent transcriptional regulator